jgi:hypothetical protein
MRIQNFLIQGQAGEEWHWLHVRLINPASKDPTLTNLESESNFVLPNNFLPNSILVENAFLMKSNHRPCCVELV